MEEDCKILNLGCGTGIISKKFSEYGTVYDLDDTISKDFSNSVY